MRVDRFTSLLCGTVISVAILGAATISKIKDIPVGYVGGPNPVWMGGALIAIEGHGTSNITVRLSDDGGNATALAFSIPGSPRIAIRSKARHTDGTVALSGVAMRGNGSWEPFLAIHAPGQDAWSLTVTAPYNASTICFSPDGTIVSVGNLTYEPGKATPEYDVLRWFDRSGRQVASRFPYSKLNNPTELIGSHLVAGPDRIGWYTGEVGNGPVGRYIEITATGEIHYFDPVPGAHYPRKIIEGIGMTPDGNVFVDTYVAKTTITTLYTLNRASGKWDIVPPPPTAPGQFFPLVGTHEDKLVMLNRAQKPASVSLYEVSR